MDDVFKPYHVCRRGRMFAVYKWRDPTKKTATYVDSYNDYGQALKAVKDLNKQYLNNI